MEEQKLTKEEEYNLFIEQHPDMPKQQYIECLDLITKRDEALKILSGDKRVEFRNDTFYYESILYNFELQEWRQKAYLNKEITVDELFAFTNPTRPVFSIHFHDIHNTWYLDVEVNANNLIRIDQSNVSVLQKEYACHELDDFLKEIENEKASGIINGSNQPCKFYFALGNVVSTNLK